MSRRRRDFNRLLTNQRFLGGLVQVVLAKSGLQLSVFVSSVRYLYLNTFKMFFVQRVLITKKCFFCIFSLNIFFGGYRCNSTTIV